MSDSFYTETGSSVGTPSSGYTYLYVETDKRMRHKDTTGLITNVSGFNNYNTSDVTCSSADTYLTGSSIAVPSTKLQVGTIIRWTFGFSKSGAGTAASPTFIIRVGTAGTTADTARITFTSPLTQTANADQARVDITARVRSIGASGVMEAALNFSRKGISTTGFHNAALSSYGDAVTSSGFDMTVANLIVGVSCNPGATGSPVWTFQTVVAEAFNL